MIKFCFPTKCMADDNFSEAPRRADFKNPIFIAFFCRFLDLGHLRGPAVSLGRILGAPSIEPLGGGPGQRAVSNPPPLFLRELKTCLPQRPGVCVCVLGGRFGTRPWWLALLACGGAYWPLVLKSSVL